MRKKVNVEVKTETWKAIKAYAIFQGKCLGELVEEILHDYLLKKGWIDGYSSLPPTARTGRKEAD